MYPDIQRGSVFNCAMKIINSYNKYIAFLNHTESYYFKIEEPYVSWSIPVKNHFSVS